ncbi:hypothetical protein J437_LFUL001137 [Ladona fulva]|uniref:Uncharacterized protein n=1 Tax=Ladona fulva TaxID=123851 RepID=A0A8K0NTG6_LADFU|nr:hypothetical protein J437_LFUL001137 [Ladona fulva]
MEEPKLASDSAQITSLEEISKKMVIHEASQNVTGENQKQIIQIPHSSSSVIPDLMPEKDTAEFTSCDTTVLHSGGDRVINVQSESVPSGHHMQILEVPVSESSSHTSVITSLAEKSNPQASFGSTSQVEFPAVGVPVLVPYIVLLPGTVILDQSLS